MEGFRPRAGKRFRLWLLATAAGGAVGCHTTRPQHEINPLAGIPQNSERSGVFGRGGPKNMYGPPPEQVVVKSASKKKQGVKPETDVAWADSQVEAALSEGRTGVEKDRLLDDARHRYRKALAADPKNKAALLGLARLYAKSGDIDRSVQTYREALLYFPQDHELAFAYGKMLCQAERWDAARDQIRQALAIDPENRHYHRSLAYALARNNEWDAAFGTMLKVTPEAEARYFLGQIMLDVNREPDAKKQFGLALQADPNHPATQEILARLALPATTSPETTNPIQTTGFQR